MSFNKVIESVYGPIIINRNDSIIGKIIEQNGYWVSDDVEIIKGLVEILLRERDLLLFYDVGANVGTFSLAIGKSYGARVKIRAFEAQRQVFYMLCGTVALNGLQNIFCYHGAVGDMVEKEISIDLPDYNDQNNFGGLELVKARASDDFMTKTKSENVNCILLDSFDEKVDFIKMDIEGMEDQALRGARRIIETSRPMCFLEISKTDFNFVMNFFKSLDYIGYLKFPDLLVIPSECRFLIHGLHRCF